MANLESSWQASVVQLAQAGNPRALTFWLNRFLVPQGVCLQVTVEQPGALLIRMMCHQHPDAQHLIPFLTEQLTRLNPDTFRMARITAQQVGLSEVAWERVVHIPAVEPAQPLQPPLSAESWLGLAGPTVVNAAAPPLSGPAQSAPATVDASTRLPTAAQKRAVRQRRGQPRGKSQERSLYLVDFASVQAEAIARPGLLLQMGWSQRLAASLSDLSSRVLHSTAQPIHWVLNRRPRTRLLFLGSSSVAAFLLGCGFEIVNHHMIGSAPRSAGSGVLNPRPNAPASIQTALGQVPVIHQTVNQPDDPVVTLMFSNRGALGQGYIGRGMEPYYQADVIMTSLDHALNSAPASNAPDTYGQAFLDSSSAEANDDAANSEDEVGAEMATDAEGVERDRPNETTLHALQAASVDLVSLAGASLGPSLATEQFSQTLSLLHQNTIYSVGAGLDPSLARRPQIFEVKGTRIAYLGYSDPTAVAALAEAAGLSRDNLETQITADIKAIRHQVDWIIVSYDWNRPLRAYPEEWQVKLTHAAIDAGADLVVGYQPGITQGAEIYRGRAIAYSLGNDIDDYADDAAKQDYETVALKVSLEDQQMKLEFLPIRVRQGEPIVVAGDEGADILRYLKQASSLFDQPMQLPTVLDARVHLSAPSAPNSTLPTEPFISYPDSSP